MKVVSVLLSTAGVMGLSPSQPLLDEDSHGPRAGFS